MTQWAAYILTATILLVGLVDSGQTTNSKQTEIRSTDTIDYWHVLYNNKKIREYNRQVFDNIFPTAEDDTKYKTGGWRTIILKTDTLKVNDSLSVTYYSDSPPNASGVLEGRLIIEEAICPTNDPITVLYGDVIKMPKTISFPLKTLLNHKVYQRKMFHVYWEFPRTNQEKEEQASDVLKKWLFTVFLV